MILVGLTGTGAKQESIMDIHNALTAAGIKLNVIFIKPEDIVRGVYQNINFDIIISLNGDAALNNQQISDEISGYMRNIFEKVKEDGTIIINIDDENSLRLIRGIKTHIITYGFNSKASLTASSVGDNMSGDDYIFCLQRAIKNIKNEKIEPQEFSIKLFKYNKENIHDVLGIAAFLLVCGIDTEKIRNFFLYSYNDN